MVKVRLGQVKKLREKTGAGVMEVRRALLEAGGDEKKAEEFLRQEGQVRAKKKAERQAGDGLVEAYVHNTGRVAALVEVACETDFVARTEEFKHLVHELAMQVASMDPATVAELMSQEYIRDPGKMVEDLVRETIAKTGENIVVRRFIRFELGGE